MKIQVFLFLISIAFVNLGFLDSFLIRYGLSVPEYNFLALQKQFYISGVDVPIGVSCFWSI
jgi:hypothetical protein